MTDSTNWTPPDIHAILQEFEARDPSTPNLDLINQYIDQGQTQPLRTLFEVLTFQRARAEHLSSALLAFIHTQLSGEPRVREYFDTQIKEHELTSVASKMRQSNSPARKTKTAAAQEW